MQTHLHNKHIYTTNTTFTQQTQDLHNKHDIYTTNTFTQQTQLLHNKHNSVSVVLFLNYGNACIKYIIAYSK
jgi:hypothetical protein